MIKQDNLAQQFRKYIALQWWSLKNRLDWTKPDYDEDHYKNPYRDRFWEQPLKDRVFNRCCSVLVDWPLSFVIDFCAWFEARFIQKKSWTNFETHWKWSRRTNFVNDYFLQPLANILGVGKKIEADIRKEFGEKYY